MKWSADPENLKMIEALASAKAPSGFEDETIAAAKPWVENIGPLKEDHLRNFLKQ